jgi:hypothetical protein
VAVALVDDLGARRRAQQRDEHGERVALAQQRVGADGVERVEEARTQAKRRRRPTDVAHERGRKADARARVRRHLAAQRNQNVERLQRNRAAVRHQQQAHQAAHQAGVN